MDGVNTLSEYSSKRAIDIVIATLMLLASMPLFLCIAAWIWLKDGGPVFYAHERVGRNGRRFGCLKFRSMVKNSAEILTEILENDPEARAEWEASQKLRDDPRIIPGVGQFLRKSSLDELPQLINVLRGDMSLVGPRPVTEAELAHYGEYLDHYLALRPGMTGPWQVSGRSDTDYSQRVRLDASYASQNSILSDLSIMATTLPAVVARRGAYVIPGALLLQAMDLGALLTRS